MRSGEQETGCLNLREVISAAARQREMHLASTLKRTSVAWAGHAVLALLFVTCVAYVAIGSVLEVQSPAQAQIAVAMAAPPWVDNALPASGIAAAVAAPETAASPPADQPDPDGDSNVMTYQHN